MPSFKPILNTYYTIEGSLLKSNSVTTASSSGEFLKVINGIDMKTIPADGMKKFMSLQKKLISDATYLSKSKSLTDQRTRFADLSTNLYLLSKVIKISDKPMYYDYCPMKKSYWLAANKDIKNPYYDSPMQDCGMISETNN